MTDIFLRGARLVPVTAQAPDEPVGVLVRDGVVTEVGRLTRPPGVEEIDAGGRWLAPGLWDQHVHLGQWVAGSQRLDLSGTDSPEEVVRRVARRLDQRPGRALVAYGHRSGTWTREATVAELDRVAGDVPVVLVSGDAHHAWLSTAGLRALRLAPRDEVVREQEWFAAYPRLASLGDEDDSPAAFETVLRAAAAKGVVGLVDFEFGGSRDAWRARWHQGCDLLRVRWATYEVAGATGLRTGDRIEDGLTMGPLKIIGDGSLNTRTAWCCEPYADGDRLEHPAGLPNLSAAELQALMAAGTAAGLEIALHAIGDAAVDAALTAYEVTGARGSVEHAQLVARHDVPRLAALPVRASVQPAHLLDDRDVTERIWPGRGGRCFAWRWLLDAGVPVVLGSDAPVAPLDPWLAIAAAVHRSADDREAWHPEQALTPSEGLACSTDGQGTVAPGSRGDLVLLDADPLAPAPDTAVAGQRLRTMPVALTAVAGRVVHRSL